MAPRAASYDISLRSYGWNAVSGIEDDFIPREIGLLFVVTAQTQELAKQIAKTCNPLFFHMPLHREAELPSYAFPSSPVEIERGAVYEFLLKHVIEVNVPCALVWTTFIDLREKAHAVRRALSSSLDCRPP